MDSANLLWPAVFLPLLGALGCGFFLSKAPKVLSHVLASAVMVGSFALMVFVYVNYLLSGAEAPIVLHGFDWFAIGTFNAPYNLQLDRLSGFMMLIVTGIGSLIHIYAGGYMHEEEKTYRFFAYLNLFVFMMLQLVLGDNLLVMFVGWEGVGLCSYLLIGYWFSERANADAGMKAFIANRIGDVGFILATFMCFGVFGTIRFEELRQLVLTANSADFPFFSATLISLFLFVAACGKSAQIPLYVWLPDAMAGPTPVSALIHAATMVTAGVYMMCRMNPIFYTAPEIMDLIAVVGVSTAIFAATIALVQNDIKKVLAYSTVSQLGFMVMACGVGAFGAGFFHVFTHACFKALLFMGAGSVIVAMHHEQDMNKMGGLRKYLPITHAVMLIGVLAIIGVPGFSGFFSKDEILWHAYLRGGYPLWLAAVFGACLTAFYMTRMLCLSFYGANRSDAHTREHLHETSPVMWGPLVPLAILSVIAGYIGVPEFIFGEGSNWLHHYLGDHVVKVPAFMHEEWDFLHAHHSLTLEWGLLIASSVCVLSSALFSFFTYGNGLSLAMKNLSTKFSGLYRLMQEKWRIDELYEVIVIGPLRDLAEFLYKIVDSMLVDGLVNVLARTVNLLSAVLSFKMSGNMQRHAMVILIGFVCLASMLIFS